MTIRHLKIFIAVAETGSMSKAAQKLYLSQPTVSQAILELEKHYHLQLFDRLARKLYITEEGKRLLSLAHQAVEQFDTLEFEMKENQQTPSLRLGSSITVGTCLIPYVIQDLERQIPNISIFSVSSNTRDIEQRVLQSQLDAAIVEGNVTSPDLICIPVIHDRLVLCCSSSHPFYQRERLHVTDLNNQRFAMREQGSGTRKLFEQYLQRYNVQINIGWEANCPRTILNAVLQNHMLSVMSSRLMRHELAHNRIWIFQNETDEWDRSFKLIYHKNKFLTPELLALREILEHYKHLDLPSGKKLGVLSHDFRET